MNNKKIYLVTDPDGDRTVFDTENAAKKYVIQQIKNCNILDDEYIDYIKNFMIDKPNTAPPSYYAFVNDMLQTIGDMENFDYSIEELIIMTEEDI